MKEIILNFLHLIKVAKKIEEINWVTDYNFAKYKISEFTFSAQKMQNVENECYFFICNISFKCNGKWYSQQINEEHLRDYVNVDFLMSFQHQDNFKDDFKTDVIRMYLRYVPKTKEFFVIKVLSDRTIFRKTITTFYANEINLFKLNSLIQIIKNGKHKYND
jgi:hypothetical protein